MSIRRTAESCCVAICAWAVVTCSGRSTQPVVHPAQTVAAPAATASSESAVPNVAPATTAVTDSDTDQPKSTSAVPETEGRDRAPVREVCDQAEPRPSARELTSRPPKRESPSVESKTLVVEDCRTACPDCNTYCHPRLEVPLVRSSKVQAALDETWQSFVGFEGSHACSVYSHWFVVNYDAHGLLSVTFRLETQGGAHPSVEGTQVNLDSGGEKVLASRVFRDTALPQVIQLIDERLQRSREQYLAGEWSAEDRDEIVTELNDNKELHFKVQNADEFVITDKGLEFRFEYRFRHWIRALEPPNGVLLTYRELLPYLNPKGPFSWAIKRFGP